ncbi:hypothetical protein ABPG74_001500 [Tetrahymena malaccensis]
MFASISVNNIKKKEQVYQQIVFESKDKKEIQIQDQIMIALYFDIHYIIKGLKQDSLLWKEMEPQIKSSKLLQNKITDFLINQAQQRDKPFQNAIKHIFDSISNEFTAINFGKPDNQLLAMLNQQGYQFFPNRYPDKSYTLEILDPKQSSLVFNDLKQNSLDQKQNSLDQKLNSLDLKKFQLKQEQCSKCEYNQEVFIQYGGNQKYCLICFEEAFSEYI